LPEREKLAAAAAAITSDSLTHSFVCICGERVPVTNELTCHDLFPLLITLSLARSRYEIGRWERARVIRVKLRGKNPLESRHLIKNPLIMLIAFKFSDVRDCM
jgi:hypothetical protein